MKQQKFARMNPNFETVLNAKQAFSLATILQNKLLTPFTTFPQVQLMDTQKYGFRLVLEN